jgi:3-oxoacyl-[acyl-carrier-protein] synthase II
MVSATSGTARVLVTGLGPVTCLGVGMDDLAHGISEAIVMRETDLGRPGARPGFGVVREFDLKDYVGTKRPYLDPQTKSALAAAAAALANAGVEPDEVEPLRCGLSFATVLGNLETQMLFQRMVEEKGMRLGSPVLFSHAYANSTNSVLSIEFSLRGCNANFCGDLLCGAQALESAWLALQSGRADLMLAGGADVTGPELLERLRRDAAPDGPVPAQGACLLVMETQDSVERREGYAFCELGSVVCQGLHGVRSTDEAGRRLRAAIGRAMDEAGIWSGDVGIIVLGSGRALHDEMYEAQALALSDFSQVPRMTAKHFVGETYAAGFPLECALAADALNEGSMPPRVTFEGKRRGVEFWVERQPDPMMGHSALVVGCTPDLAAAAVLRAL